MCSNVIASQTCKVCGVCARTDPYCCFNISIIPPRAAQPPLAKRPSGCGTHRTGRGGEGGSSPATPAGRAAAAPRLLCAAPGLRAALPARALRPRFPFSPSAECLSRAAALCGSAGAEPEEPEPLPPARPGPPAAESCRPRRCAVADAGREARKVGRGARGGGGTTSPPPPPSFPRGSPPRCGRGGRGRCGRGQGQRSPPRRGPRRALRGLRPASPPPCRCSGRRGVRSPSRRAGGEKSGVPGEGQQGNGRKGDPPSRSRVPPNLPAPGATPKPRTCSSKLPVAGAESVVRAGRTGLFASLVSGRLERKVTRCLSVHLTQTAAVPLARF